MLNLLRLIKIACSITIPFHPCHLGMKATLELVVGLENWIEPARSQRTEQFDNFILF